MATPRIPPGERVYAIGDVHGRLDLLQELVAKIRADNAARAPARVRIVLIGDIIDRGPDSAGIADRCMALTARTDSLVVLKGNHEAMMVDALRGDFVALALWLRHGGVAALQSWGVAEEQIAAGASPALFRAMRERVPAEMLAWLADRPLMHRIGDYLFVHAGIRHGIPIEDQVPADLLWIRGAFLDSEADAGVVVVHGHSISETVTMRPNRIGIDTGAYRSGILSALGLEEERRWTLATGAAPLEESADPSGIAAESLHPESDAAVVRSDPLGDDLRAILGPDAGAPRRAGWYPLLASLAVAAIGGATFMVTRPSPEVRPAPPPSTTIALSEPAPVAPTPVAPALPVVVQAVPAPATTTMPPAAKPADRRTIAAHRTPSPSSATPHAAGTAAAPRRAAARTKPAASPAPARSAATSVPAVFVDTPPRPTVVVVRPPRRGAGTPGGRAPADMPPVPASPAPDPATTVVVATPERAALARRREKDAIRGVDAMRLLRRQ